MNILSVLHNQFVSTASDIERLVVFMSLAAVNFEHKPAVKAVVRRWLARASYAVGFRNILNT